MESHTPSTAAQAEPVDVEELEKRQRAEGLRYWKERGDAMDAWRAQRRAQREEEEEAAKAESEAASAVAAARATLAVRAAWGGRA